MALKGEQVKPIEERREIVLKALKIMEGFEKGTIVGLAGEHGVTRGAIYDYLSFVTDDPEGRLREAEEEVEFRREVLKLIGDTDGMYQAPVRFPGWFLATPKPGYSLFPHLYAADFRRISCR